VDSFDISLHLDVDLLTPLRKIRLGKVPVTISFLEKFINAIEGGLGRETGSSAYCDNVVVNALSLFSQCCSFQLIKVHDLPLL
jgi:hypothetical protein